jgi:hypothetical protein
MDKNEARKIVNEFIYTKDPSKKDEESFLMAADYLVEKENDVDAMVNLGSYYYSKKKYLFAENYYLLANQYENDFAPLALGYIYFRGLNLKPDFEKAFFYFLTAYQRGNIEASIKIIDMLLDGIGIKRNISQAKQILKDVFNKIVNDNKYSYIYPEIVYRYITLYPEEKNIEKYTLINKAKILIGNRIKNTPSLTNFKLMSDIVLYMFENDYIDENYDIFDLLYLTNNYLKIVIYSNYGRIEINSVNNDEEEQIIISNNTYNNIYDALINHKISNLSLFELAYEDNVKILVFDQN